MHGPEPGKTVGRRSFDHWDLWFLVVLVTDHADDWRALGDRLAAKLKGHGFERNDAEAELSLPTWSGASRAAGRRPPP